MTVLVRTEVTPEAVGRLHLDDASHRNVLSFEMSEAIADGVGAVMAAGARVLVLSAEPPVFCAGGSLDGLLRGERPLSATYRGYLALARCPVPTVAVVIGAAIGAGVNLALACDVVIAGRSARFDPRFLDVGIHPGGGHLRRLIDRVGSQGAAALSLFGDALTGEEAARAGLAWRCVADSDAEELASLLAGRAAGRDAELVRTAKQSLHASAWVSTHDEAFALELTAQQWSVDRPEFRSAAEAVRQSIAARSRTDADSAL